MTTLDASNARQCRLDQALTGLMHRAWRRIFVAGYIHRLGWSLTIALGLLAVIVIIERFTPTPWLSLKIVGAVLAAAFVTPAISTFVRMPRGVALADDVDRRTGLRECLSTSYLVAGSTDGWSRAIVENAIERSRRVVLRDAIPIRMSGVSANGPLIAVIVFAGLFMFMPRNDMTGVLAKQQEEEKKQEQYELAVAEVKTAEKKLEEVLTKAGVELGKEDDGADADEAASTKPKTADEVKREAIRKLTRVSEQLEAVKENENAKTLKAMQQSMRQLKAAPPGPAQEFQRELARGNFAAAKEQLEQLAQQATEGKLSEEQREQLGEQLGQLAEQLEQLSKQNDSLEQALREAGITAEQAKQAAKDPNALEDMLNKLPGIEAPQMQALRQMAQAQQKANESMQSMAQSAQQMSQACENPGQGQPGQQMSQSVGGMSSELSASEMMASEQSAADAAMSEAQSQLQSMGDSMCEGGACMGDGNGPSEWGKTGDWQSGSSTKTGPGSGGGGRGTGAGPDALPTDYVLKREKANVNNQGGPIIGSTVVYGNQIRGESEAQFGEVVDAATVEAAEALETMTVPREYHDAVKAYFGRLEAAAKAKESAPEKKTDG